MTAQKTLLTREAILEKLEPFNRTNIRHVPDSSDSRVVIDENTVVIRPTRGARGIEVETSEGLPNTLKVVGLPLDLAHKLSPGTFAACLSELLKKKEHYDIVVRNDKVVDLVPFKAERGTLQAERLLNAIEKQIPVQGYNRLLFLDDQMLQLEVVGEKTEPVVPGDLVQAGVLVRFSPLNIHIPAVQAYALRLDCTNGACSMINFAEFHGGGGGHGHGDNGGNSRGNESGGDFWNWFRINVKKAYGSLDKVVATWRKLVDEKIDPKDRASIIAAMLKEARLKGEVADEIRAMAIEQPPENSWDIFNYITYASSHLLESPREIVAAMSAGADYAAAETHQRICPVCKKAR
jgi:hypothetical protein